MRNILLKNLTAQDIDDAVEKVLRDLHHPEPPLRLEDVRELLELDREYYSSSDDSTVREVVHRLKIAGKQVLARPTLLKEAIQKWNLRALLIPDRKRILIDSELPPAKHRWVEAHEIGHKITPWHGSTMMGDDKATLTPGCHEQIEAEANYAAGQLLFLREQFRSEARDCVADLHSVIALQKRYANTFTTTLWRYVEQSDTMMLGALCCHPHRLSSDFSPSEPLRYFIRSPRFAERFSGVTECRIFELVHSYSADRRGGPLGETDAVLKDDYGQVHLFHFETFFNGYDALTLGVYRYPSPTMAFISLH